MVFCVFDKVIIKVAGTNPVIPLYKYFLTNSGIFPRLRKTKRYFSILLSKHFLNKAPDQFQKAFSRWTRAICSLCRGSVVAVDGKTLRRSHYKSYDKAGIQSKRLKVVWDHDYLIKILQG